jgi:hypothetical protein
MTHSRDFSGTRNLRGASVVAALALLALAAVPAAADEKAGWRPATGTSQARWTPEADPVPVSELPCTGASSEATSATPAVVKPGDDRCGASGITVPVPAEAISCLQAETRQYLWELYQLGDLEPVAPPAGTPPLTAAEVESIILARPIPVQMYAWPVWLELGAANAQPWQGCAAGVAWKGEIWVSLRDGDVRSRKLVAWETANNIVAWGLGRHDLGDSATIVGGATNRAYAVCSATPWAMR